MQFEIITFDTLEEHQVAASSLKVKKRRDMIQWRIRSQFVNYMHGGDKLIYENRKKYF